MAIFPRGEMWVQNIKILLVDQWKLLSLAFLFLLLLIPTSFIIAKNLLAKQWTQDKAVYLAHRVLLDPIPNDIQKLSRATSARSAVDMLFAPVSQTEEQAYQQGLADLQNKKDTYKNEIQFNNVEYTYQMIHDPDRARRMLYYLWENIFSVDGSEADDGILYDDVKKLDNTIYADAYGNYPQMVEDVRNNYAMARYLDLTNSPKNDPNENFARELMQLFLIGPYTPLDKTQSHSNYSDADVNALAYILTGYKVDKQARTIYFDPRDHYAGQKEFLGDQFNDPIHVISYIEQKKKHEMAEFLASKLLHYYVSDTPLDNDVIAVASLVEKNNFEILPTVKELLSSDIMYNPLYMQQERFKSPPQLVTSFYTTLFGRNNYSVIPSASILTDLDFQPYRPGSIFGRDGFNSNSLFYSGTIVNKWIGDAQGIVGQNMRALKMLQNNVGGYTSQTVSILSQKLSLSSPLPQRVQGKLAEFLSRTSQKTQQQTFAGLLELLFAQPEFLTVSGNTQSASLPRVSKSQNTSDSPILVVVRIKGGYDYQQLVANTQDPSYYSNRKEMALTPANSTSLGNGYVLNNAAQSLLSLLQKKEAFLISGVGLPNQSRAHDVASKQMETGLLSNGNGILAQLAVANSSVQLISFTNTPPIMLKGQQSLQIGSANLELFQQKKKGNTGENVGQTLISTFSQRQFPSLIASYYNQALLLDSLAKQNVANGGKGTPGNTNTTQLSFLEQLIANHVGNTYYLYADNGYDTHVNEGLVFEKQIKELFDNLTQFYNDEKDKRKVAIVVFSEFGRTNKVNGGKGTDHGIGGGMVVLSNVLSWPEMIGSLTPSTDKYNWSDVKVDERDVWATLFHDLYQLPQNAVFGGTQNITSYPATVN